MRVFISWAGARSRVLGSCMRDWLEELLPEVEPFHSDGIPKGEQWLEVLVAELAQCDAGVFCVTPESLRSQWMLFEAGAISRRGGGPRVFTYLYGTSQVDGPLAAFQATRFTRDDSRQLALSLAQLDDAVDAAAVDERFEKSWPDFEAEVLRRMAHPIQEVLPDFPGLFEQSKTFNEPFPDCTDKGWPARIARIASIQERLASAEYAEILDSDPYLAGAGRTLKRLLDRYRMHIGGLLLTAGDFDALDREDRRKLEGARREILDLVRSLQQDFKPPIFRESFAFESDTSTPGRKMAIHDMHDRLRHDKLPADQVEEGRSSLDWGLDRIVFYLAAGSGRTRTTTDELIELLRLEEEQARTRGLVIGLQPLYYALECVEDFIQPPLSSRQARRLRELVDDIARFVDSHDGRDSGGHIARRLASLRPLLEDSRDD